MEPLGKQPHHPPKAAPFLLWFVRCFMGGRRPIVQLLFKAGDKLLQRSEAGDDFFHFLAVMQQLNGDDVICFLLQLPFKLVQARGDAGDFGFDRFM